AFFSLLAPGANIKPHCDGSNVLLTCHLGLKVPSGCGIRVGWESKSWEEGKCLIFNTSFEHEVWNRSHDSRYVLLLNFWHPELTLVEREFLLSSFDWPGDAD
ncbi:MAG: aspartyl/asparaginyl beta-hydroxylase domain-containing protein, partial [Terriglobia bacterium]